MNIPVTERVQGDDACAELGGEGALGYDPGMEQAPTLNPGDEEMAAWAPLIAAWGRIFVDGTVRQWWEEWRRKSADTGVILGTLREIASRKGEQALVETQVDSATGDWLRSVGGPTCLDAQTARRWLGVWAQLQRAQRQGRLSRRQAGPNEERDPVDRTVLCGAGGAQEERCSEPDAAPGRYGSYRQDWDCHGADRDPQ